jgi:predicted dehydrogenase
MSVDAKKFHLGLVGCGRISQSWIEAIKQCKHIQLESIMDVNPEFLKTITELTKAAAFTDLEQFIHHKKLDGVIISSPPSTHREVACKLMEAGISVICEKPLALTLQDGIHMYDLAKKNDVVLMMGSKFRYVEDIIRTKSIIATGMLGKIHFYSNQFCSQVNMVGRWNSNPQISGGGVIMDNGPHAIDIIRYLLGPIAKIFAHESTRAPGLEVEDTATISVITKSNVISTINLSWSINLLSNSYIEIYGTDGAIKVGWKDSLYQHSGHPSWISYGVGYQKIGAFKSQLENFITTVHGTHEPIITPEDGLASIGIIEAAYESLRTGKWVEVQEFTANV